MNALLEAAKRLSPDPFKGLTRNQARVAIMQDVLDQLLAGRIRATKGVYLTGQDRWHSYTAKEVRLLGPDKEVPRCDACAVGSVFMAAVHCANRFDQEHLIDDDRTLDRNEMTDYLEAWFDLHELRQMEGFFESPWHPSYARGWYPVGASSDLIHATSNDRLAALAINVIANNGKFIPDEL